MTYAHVIDILGKQDKEVSMLDFDIATSGLIIQPKDLKAVFDLIINNLFSQEDENFNRINYLNTHCKGLSPTQIQQAEESRDKSCDFHSDIIIRNLWRIIDNQDSILHKVIQPKQLSKVLASFKAKTLKLFQKDYRNQALSSLYEAACELEDLANSHQKPVMRGHA